jgi:hypothetical protein
MGKPPTTHQKVIEVVREWFPDLAASKPNEPAVKLSRQVRAEHHHHH